MSRLGLLLVVLTVLCGLTSAFTAEKPNESWVKFEKNHMDPKGNIKGESNYCTKVINDRMIREKDGRCKPSNTLIHEEATAVLDLCSKKEWGDATSKRPFRFTLCHLVGDRDVEWCKYKDSVTNIKKPITVSCEAYVPVHLEKIHF